MSLVKNSKEDLGFGGNINQGLDKTIILQETKIFNETPLDVKMCCSVLAKVIYMIHVGETLGMYCMLFEILNLMRKVDLWSFWRV